MIEHVKPLKLDTGTEGGSKIFFTSDLHFGHRNIIEFCKRPFGSIEEMDEALIENWNSVVGHNDWVFNLGDFAFAPHHRWVELLAQLHGKHVLILGNHDIIRWPGDKIMQLFYRVEQQMILQIDERTVILNHYPFLCYGGAHKGPGTAVYALHGHVHQSPYSESGKDEKRLPLRFPYQYDVGVDNNNFTPVSWEEVKAIIEYQVAKYEPNDE